MGELENHLQWIENQSDTMKTLLENWVNINSGSENTSGLDEMLQSLAKNLKVLEPDHKEIIDLPPRKIVSREGMLIHSKLGKALVIKKRSHSQFKVLLAGHMDTVFPPSSRFQKIEKCDNDRWIGPGVADMKGGLVILLKALEAFEKTTISQKIGWEVIITPDEEIGSTGSYELYRQAALRNNVGLIFEPCFADGAFVKWRKGSANLTLIVRGKSAHAGRDFHVGRSAIYALADAIKEIEKLNTSLQGATVNIGHIEGGGPVNIVPDLAICRINIRAITADELLQLKSGITAIAQRSREGIQMELVEDYSRLPKPFDEKTEKLFSLVEECAKQLKMPFKFRESGGVCDGNILSEMGLPTFDSAGATGGHLHTEQEYIHPGSLVEKSKLAFLILHELALKNTPVEKM